MEDQLGPNFVAVAGRQVRLLILDIRGCKPLDTAAFERLRAWIDEAKQTGVEQFVRMGDGTLVALQLRALEQEADIEDCTSIINDEAGLLDFLARNGYKPEQPYH